MLKTCKYCGGIVPEEHICCKKPNRWKHRKDIKEDSFRHTYEWTNKSIAIRKRDNYLCKVCINKKYETTYQYNTKNLEVHHIVPIKEDYSKRLEDDNLITLCSYHHKMADNGEIPRDELIAMISPHV